MTVDELRAAAMRLGRDERAILAAELLDSVQDPEPASQSEVDSLWAAELNRRSAELRSGSADTFTWDSVRVEIEADLAERG